MEKQINSVDQNNQQIRQNPVDQPTGFPRNPKINYWMISTIILVIIVVLGSFYTINLINQQGISDFPSTSNSEQQTQPVPTLSDSYSKNLQYEFKTCDRPSEIDEMKEDSVDLVVSNNSIKFVQTLNTYCNTTKDNLKLTYSRRDNDLQIDEIFTSMAVATCVCPFEINGVISDLEKGIYKIIFVFDNRYTNQRETIKALEFEIK